MRNTVAAIERELERLQKASPDVGENKGALSALAAPWADLVAQLALGPEPPTRNCPTCGAIGMRNATLCGNCWAKLVPPADAD